MDENNLTPKEYQIVSENPLEVRKRHLKKETTTQMPWSQTPGLQKGKTTNSMASLTQCVTFC